MPLAVYLAALAGCYGCGGCLVRIARGPQLAAQLSAAALAAFWLSELSMLADPSVVRAKICRRLGITKMTLYRRFPGGDHKRRAGFAAVKGGQTAIEVSSPKRANLAKRGALRGP